MPVDGYLDYIELPAADIEAAKRFYGTLFGWTFVDYGPDYVEFDSTGRKGGFHAGRAPIAGSGPLIVLYAADLDAMETRLRAAGAPIIEHHAFPGGRRFHFHDPNGNELAMWTKD